MKRKAKLSPNSIKYSKKIKKVIGDWDMSVNSDDETSSSMRIVELRSASTSNVVGDTALTIHDLPGVLLVRIFETLSAQQRIRLERVCKRWNELSKFAWSKFRTINYSSFTPDFAPIAMQIWPTSWRRPVLNNQTLKAILVRCGKHLKCLDLSGYRDTLDYRVLPLVGQHCPNLELINLTGILVTNSSLRSLALRCFKLKSVIFQRCFQDSIIDRGLSYLLSNCPELTSLNLSENERITGNCFQDLPRKLKYLVLSTCYELQEEGILALSDRCPDLEVLHLDSCDHVTGKSLEYAFRKLTKLRVLHLGEYYATSQGTQSLTLSKLNHLRELYLNDNYLVSDSTLDGISFACVNLEKLDISGGNKSITDEGLIHLCRLKYLKKLNLSYLCRITDVGLKALAKQGRLDVLLMHRCMEMTDDSIVDLAKYCIGLTKLDLSCCLKISDVSVWAFFSNANRRTSRLSLCVGRTGVSMKEKDIHHPMLDLNFADYTFYWQFRGGVFD